MGKAMNRQSWRNGLRGAVVGAAVTTALACSDSAGPGAGCNVNGTGTTNDVRFQVVNAGDVPGITVALSIGSDMCIIGLPTSVPNVGIELGQWLTMAGIGTTVDVDASMGGSAFPTTMCTVTAQAFVPNGTEDAGQAFIGVFSNGAQITSVTCDIGFN